MPIKLTKLTLAAVVALAAFAATAYAVTYTVLKLDFSTRAQVRSMKFRPLPGAGRNCGKAHRAGKMRVAVGKNTTECSWVPPVTVSSEDGKNQEDMAINVSSVLSKSTPSSKRSKTFMSVGLRLADGNTKFRLDVYPGKFRLRRYSNDEIAGNAKVLASGKHGYIEGAGGKNRLRLAVTQLNGTTVKLRAKINGHVVAASVIEPTIDGPRSIVSIGTTSGSANGAVGTFDNLTIQRTF
jgi:hypothetical protein